MRISDWSSDVCSSDLPKEAEDRGRRSTATFASLESSDPPSLSVRLRSASPPVRTWRGPSAVGLTTLYQWPLARSEEHTSELQSLMRISYAVFCLKKKNKEDSIKKNSLNAERRMPTDMTE